MTISINNPVQATYIFIAILILASLIFCRKKKNSEFFPVSLSQELKGLAILAVVFSHIGYFLITDHRFLFPLSVLAGAGINLFLFLSGYGLTISSLQKKYSLWQFYKRRLLKLFIPLWISLAVFLILDFFVLKISYSWSFIAQSIIGIFSQADLYHSFNSPLWYFTLILFYYLIFPLIFLKKYPWLSALGLYIISAVLISFKPLFLAGTLGFYKLHLIAFPLGMAAANLIANKNIIKFSLLRGWLRTVSYYLSLAALIFIVGYTAIYSGVGQKPLTEELMSLVTMFAILGIFILKKINLKLFYVFGLFSYEIYLLHWPILYRYDIFFRFLPAWLALSLYLILFLGLGWLLQNISKIIKSR
jgi:peptidoglycan/LPS O-acetylase OafA/YrhL